MKTWTFWFFVQILLKLTASISTIHLPLATVTILSLFRFCHARSTLSPLCFGINGPKATRFIDLTYWTHIELCCWYWAIEITYQIVWAFDNGGVCEGSDSIGWLLDFCNRYVCRSQPTWVAPRLYSMIWIWYKSKDIQILTFSLKLKSLLTFVSHWCYCFLIDFNLPN